MTAYAAFNNATGVLRAIIPDLSYLQAGEGSVVVPATIEPDFADWSTSARAFTPSLPKLKAFLVDTVKREAENRKMIALTAGGAKKAIYAQQAAEVAAYRSVPVLAVLGVMLTIDRKKFRFAYWSARRRGETTIASAIKRFEDGGDPSNEDVARLEAIEQFGCEAIRSVTVTTFQGARDAYAAINWNWTG